MGIERDWRPAGGGAWRIAAALCLAAGLLCSPSVAGRELAAPGCQEPPEPEAQEPPHPEEEAPAAEGREDPEQILRRIREHIRQAEEALLRAGSGEAGRGAQERAVEDLRKLLDRARDRQDQVAGDLDRLIRMARERESRSGGGGGGRQRTQPRPGNRDRPQGGDRPEDAPLRKREEPRKEKTEAKPPGSPKGRHEAPDLNEEWGNLPPSVLELLRNRDEPWLTPEYRALLRQYYKRLSDTGGR